MSIAISQCIVLPEEEASELLDLCNQKRELRDVYAAHQLAQDMADETQEQFLVVAVIGIINPLTPRKSCNSNRS